MSGSDFLNDNSLMIKVLEDRYDKMANYCQVKMDEQDWHGVMDAAVDIREILAELEIRKHLERYSKDQ